MLKKIKQMRKWTVLLIVSVLFFACGDHPKVIKTTETGQSTGVFSGDKSSPNNGASRKQVANNMAPTNTAATGEDVHTVVALETIPASRYIYIRVKEGNEEFWIATLNQEIKVGQKYHFHGGLLKTNFHSKEHNRTFEKMYLVSNLVSADHATQPTTINIPGEHAGLPPPTKNINIEGSTKIKEIVTHPQKFEGKKVQVSGKCVKLNANIMGRNWMHLQDGSKNDYDFVVTSNQMIPEGGVVTMVGTIHLKKDFGAGYYYEIIMEDAAIVKGN